MKIKLITCINSKTDYIGLNQIYKEWEEKGYVEKVFTPMLPNKRFVAWVGRIGGLALEPSDVMTETTPYEYALACQYNSVYKDMPKVLPWNFYVRDWAQFQQARKNLTGKRPIRSIFSGTIRSHGLGNARNEWIGSTEIFNYVPARRYTFQNKTMYPELVDYYNALGQARFGLCPVGDCPICQRESETVGMGAVGMYTPGVEWKYAVSPVEGRDFIAVKDVADMKAKMDAMSDKDREEISQNGMKYFDSACTPDALWKSVLRTVEEKNIKV